LGLAQKDHNEYDHQHGTTTDVDKLSRLTGRQRTRAIAGYASIGAGGLFLLTGLVLYFVKDFGNTPVPVKASLAPTPAVSFGANGQVYAGVTGTF